MLESSERPSSEPKRSYRVEAGKPVPESLVDRVSEIHAMAILSSDRSVAAAAEEAPEDRRRC